MVLKSRFAAACFPINDDGARLGARLALPTVSPAHIRPYSTSFGPARPSLLGPALPARIRPYPPGARPISTTLGGAVETKPPQRRRP